jgi:hypothetical protein|tara:strand:+ start:622 stop:960 length:339 start_codon:yes stop_codon:yes gene_type:complete
MIPADPPMISADGGVAYLATLGIHTSRRMIDNLRATGKLRHIRARGRIKYLYRAADLAAAFIEDQKCLNFPDEQRAAPITSAAPSRDKAFLKALACTTAPRLKRSCKGASAN